MLFWRLCGITLRCVRAVGERWVGWWLGTGVCGVCDWSAPPDLGVLLIGRVEGWEGEWWGEETVLFAKRALLHLCCILGRNYPKSISTLNIVLYVSFMV